MSDGANREGLAGRIAGVLRAVVGVPHPKNFTSAVICAAGSSERFGGGATKQFTELDGLPIVVRALLAYEAAECVHEIIVVAREDELPLYADFRERYGLTKLAKTVPGGQTRQESARIGSDETDRRTKFVAIADAARCLTTPDEIDRVCRAAYRWGAAAAGTRTVDTVKVTDASAFADQTPDRSRVWLAQTPQVFALNLYRAAAYACRDERFEATDDSQLAEHIRVPVKMVACSRENLKITEPDDLPLAQAILAARRLRAGGTGPSPAEGDGRV